MQRHLEADHSILMEQPAMNMPLQTTRVTITRDDLLAEGFTLAQVEALEALRAVYPYVEFLDSRQELQRLRFMKWMIGRKPYAFA